MLDYVVETMKREETRIDELILILSSQAYYMDKYQAEEITTLLVDKFTNGDHFIEDIKTQHPMMKVWNVPKLCVSICELTKHIKNKFKQFYHPMEELETMAKEVGMAFNLNC